MKNLIFTFLFIIQSTIIYSQNNNVLKDTLYLFFENNNQTMKIMCLDNNLDIPTYVFNFNINNDSLTIYFTSFLDSEKTKYFNTLNYKPSLNRKIVKNNFVNKNDLKNYNWLKNKVISYKLNNYIYVDFNPIFIVEFDKKKKKAIITRVEAVDIID